MKPSINLYENPNLGTALIENMSDNVLGWKHRTADWGGFDTASGEYHGAEDELWRMFLGGLGRRVETTLGSKVVWDGDIETLELEHAGVRMRRSRANIINQLKVIYAQYTNSHVVNGSAETAGTYGETSGPGYVGIATDPGGDYCDTIDQSAVWKTDGTYSFYLKGAGTDYGAGIALTCVGDIVAGGHYQVRFTYNLLAEGKPDGHDNAPIIIFQVVATGGGGQQWWVGSKYGYAIIEEEIVADFVATADAVGPFQFRVLMNAESEIYLDNVIIYENGTRKETAVMTDADSVARFGLRRHEFLRGAMGTAQATAEAELLLAEYAWPRTEIVGLTDSRESRLSFECAGFAHTLACDYISAGGLDEASDHVAALIAQASIVVSGIIASNSLPVFLDVSEPITLWDAIQNVLRAGDASANRWTGGVYGGKKFNYTQADADVRYVVRNGQWAHVGGAPVEPALIHPGLARYDDMVVTPYQGRDPRLVYVSAIEYDRDADAVTVEDAGLYSDKLGNKEGMRDAVAVATIARGTASVISPGASVSTHDFLGTSHAVTGLTVGHYLRATSSTSFNFAAIQDTDLPGTVAIGAGTLTVSTVNDTTTPHTHAISSSANPGAAASILASDATGSLTLVNATATDTITAKPAGSAGIALNPSAATGDFTLTLRPANLTAARTVTFANATGTVALGTGANTRIAYWASANALTGEAAFIYTAATNTMQVDSILLNGATASTLAYLSATKTFTSLANAAGYLYNDGAGALSYVAAPAPAVHDMITAHSYTGGAALDVFGLSAANTIALLTPSSNPGAAAAILASTAAGLLTLVGLTTTAVASVTTPAESWIGPSSTTGVYFKGGDTGVGTTTPTFSLDIVGNKGLRVSPTNLGGTVLIEMMAPNIVGGAGIPLDLRFVDNTTLAFRFICTLGNAAGSRYGGFIGLTDRDGYKLPLEFFTTDAGGSSSAADGIYIDSGQTANTTPYVGIGRGVATTKPSCQLDVQRRGTTTNSIEVIQRLQLNSTGTAANGYGAALDFTLQSSTTAGQSAARIAALWNDATDATRKADLVLSVFDTAEREFMRGRGSGSAAQIGFFGVTPAARPSAYIVSNGSADRAYDANATTIDELADVLGTLIGDLQALGLVG